MPLSEILLSPLARIPRRLVRRDPYTSSSSSFPLFLCHPTRPPRVHVARRALSVFGVPRFSVPRQIGNYPLARARARALARLRLIDFFDSERALSAASRSHSLYHFRHERARDRDRENREPLRAQRWLERRRDEDEAERGGGDASAFLARCVTRRKQRADGRRIMTIRSERKRDGAAMLVIARRRNWIGLLARASERERARQRVHARIIKRLFELVPVSISLDNTRLDHRRCFPREDECPVTRSADDARLRGGNIDRPCLPRREISFFAAIPSVRRGNKRSPLRAGSSRFSRNSTLWRQNVEARGAKCRSQGFRGVIFSVISDCEIRALFPEVYRVARMAD